MSLLDSMPTLATAKRRTRTKTALGGSKDTYSTTLFEERECWRQPVSDSEVLDFQQRGMAITHKVYFASDPGLTNEDILVIEEENHKVRSSAFPDASVGMGILWRVMVDLYDSKMPV